MSLTLPKTMRAVTFEQPGGPEVMQITDIPLPQRGPGEVLVRVLACGVNRPEIMQRQGIYPPPPGASPLLGLELAGEVVAAGPGEHQHAIGAHVCALTNGGAYAEYCVVPSGQCIPWPEGFDAVHAAALPETFFTVWSTVFMTAGLKPGDSILVHGGSSGIGTAAIQLARAFGAAVFVTAGSAEKCALCEELGATAIQYRDEDFVERINTLTDGRGVDIILDMIGGSYLDRNLRCLATDGRVVVIALQGGAKAENVNIARILTKRLVVTGAALRPRPLSYKAEVAKALEEEVWPRLASGEIRPLIHAVLPLDQVVEAHRLMEAGSHSGKIMLKVSDG